ncbi:AbrB/MazE/SpoVT family DNA-binding domain-containing protein [Patescibacteria group bacterium]|nr:AbrB/MazE/SpoVT family DNA-binding domain-containing protein [Patescibacteria group bacterium]
MMKYIKSFSQGQITIPKSFRDELNLGTEFWLKLKLINQSIVMEPMEEKGDREKYLNKLLKIKGDWFDMRDYKRMRRETKKREEAYDW